MNPLIRPLRRHEPDLLDTLMSRLSPRSRYLRFHSPVPALTAGMRRALLDVDERDHIALVAEADDGTPIGIARMVRSSTTAERAEVAIAVADDWHRRGVGHRLITALADRAREVGVRRLTARVLPGNEAALGLFRTAFPIHLTGRDDDAVLLTALLDGVASPITMDDVLADLVG